jgi:hypothetical protein
MIAKVPDNESCPTPSVFNTSMVVDFLPNEAVFVEEGELPIIDR